jgi:hypothetical protein
VTRPLRGTPSRTAHAFYSVSGEVAAFSNVAPCPILLDGARWTTSEHYFQAQKSHMANAILVLSTTAAAKIELHEERNCTFPASLSKSLTCPEQGIEVVVTTEFNDKTVSLTSALSNKSWPILLLTLLPAAISRRSTLLPRLLSSGPWIEQDR